MSRTRRRLAALAPQGFALLDLPQRKMQTAKLPADAGEDWRPALGALRSHCEADPARGAALEVLLSQAFVRFIVTPWSMALTSRATAHAFLSGLFDAAHGERASGWVCTAEERLAAEPRIAAGIERALFDDLGGAAAACGARLESVRPWTVAAFARGRGRARSADGWYAAIEPGWIGLGALRGGRLRELSRAAYEGDWQQALERAIRRQSLREGISESLPVEHRGAEEGIEAWLRLAA